MVKRLRENEESDVLDPLGALSDARQSILTAISFITPNKIVKYLGTVINTIDHVQSDLLNETATK